MKPSLRAILAALAASGLCAVSSLVPVRAADAPQAPAAAASAPAPAASTAEAPAPAASASAPEAAASEPAGSLDDRIQAAKADVIALNRDLLVLEEELLFPANTQVAVFVSMDVGLMFDLDSVQIKLDDKVVGTYLYTPLEVQALHRGGVQRVYLGDLRAGQHEIVAYFTGIGVTPVV